MTSCSSMFRSASATSGQWSTALLSASLYFGRSRSSSDKEYLHCSARITGQLKEDFAIKAGHYRDSPEGLGYRGPSRLFGGDKDDIKRNIVRCALHEHYNTPDETRQPLAQPSPCNLPRGRKAEETGSRSKCTPLAIHWHMCWRAIRRTT